LVFQGVENTPLILSEILCAQPFSVSDSSCLKEQKADLKLIKARPIGSAEGLLAP